MSEQSKAASEAGAAGQPMRQARLFSLAPATVYWISGLTCLALFARLTLTEGGPSTVILAICVCAATGALAAWITRRPLIAVVLMAAQVVVVTLASWLKLKYMNMMLHAYDIAFYLTSGTNIAFLWENYRYQSVYAVSAVLVSAFFCVLAYRADPIRLDRRTCAIWFAFLVGGASVSAMSTAERRHSQFEYQAMYMSTFYRSWAETIETFWRGQLIEAAVQAGKRPMLQIAETCEPKEKPPHIILIHHESMVPPSLFNGLGYDKQLDRLFSSDNGQSYRLRVETYGGASVLTEFSVMTGLSTYSFGGMRQFVQQLMSGKIKETVPKVLAMCGYRNALFYPMLRNFTGADKFFKGVGISEIFDAKSQKARRSSERDRFYYDNAVDEIERHVASSPKPMFTFIETMATHWPYDEPFEPHLQVPGGVSGTHPEISEYLRRAWIAKLDLDHLRSELERRMPGERFLLVRYGDHHPMATRVLLGYGDGTEAEDVLLDRNSIGFQTFFAVNGVNYVPEQFWSPPLLDVSYLGTVLLEAAGLPLSDVYKERKKLKQMCDGRSFDCVHRDLVLSFNRRLIESGLVSAR